MKHPAIEKLKEQALLDRIAELEKRIEKLEKKNDKYKENHYWLTGSRDSLLIRKYALQQLTSF